MASFLQRFKLHPQSSQKHLKLQISINLRPPPIDRHKSFDEDDFSRKPIVPKKVHTPPRNAISYSIAHCRWLLSGFSVETLVVRVQILYPDSSESESQGSQIHDSRVRRDAASTVYFP
ncbi:Protein STRUBBELIG-RECEPTOR FAMILY 6 [Camellia lanceoleosa]|uniref:Protein STRUBBELIG-RECEPTOR FAMILY 6 n=1 Tax=Camellia lanceoleosa TaxID=1840588 RepID=A0ACC0F8E0_9ERIC|nr:Protein STRUBBELIG-RECEPTOR FAMILY 6 [Camellia lanceoleosa]